MYPSNSNQFQPPIHPPTHSHRGPPPAWPVACRLASFASCTFAPDAPVAEAMARRPPTACRPRACAHPEVSQGREGCSRQGVGGLARQCTKAPFGFLTCCCCCCCCSGLPPTHRKASQSDSEHAATLEMLLLGGRKSLDAKDQQKVSRSTLPTYRFTSTGSHSHMDATS